MRLIVNCSTLQLHFTLLSIVLKSTIQERAKIKLIQINFLASLIIPNVRFQFKFATASAQ